VSVAASRGARAWRLAGWAYVVVLAVYLAAVTTIGEDWWLTGAALYAPRQPFVVPLLIFALAAWRVRAARRQLLVALAAQAALVLVLLGAHASLPRRATGPKLRVFSMNVFYARRGDDRILAEVKAANPDVVLLQAMKERLAPELAEALPGFHQHGNNEFLLVSRYPIRQVFEPAVTGDVHSFFIRYTLETPLGLVDVMNIHPLSPRPGLVELRHPRSGDVHELEINAALRDYELRAIAEEAARAQHPLIIAGDTNLPELSPVYRKYLSAFRDGFAEVGNGLGYTFHTRLPWMRIDRILTRGLRFVDFGVGGRSASDHRPIWADLQAQP
jgi:endonuclease/exonuclease/phosphatase (EEP) superfamily protein YafD